MAINIRDTLLITPDQYYVGLGFLWDSLENEFCPVILHFLDPDVKAVDNNYVLGFIQDPVDCIFSYARNFFNNQSFCSNTTDFKFEVKEIHGLLPSKLYQILEDSNIEEFVGEFDEDPKPKPNKTQLKLVK